MWNFINQVHLIKLFADFYINQLITGRGVIPTLQERMFRKSRNCICGDTDGDEIHIVLKSPKWNDYRTIFFMTN